MSTHHIDFHPVVVTATTEHDAARHVLTWPMLTVVRAAEVKPGDLIISGFRPADPYPRADYFASGPYTANPEPYDPTCGCGACDLEEALSQTNTVVLTKGHPWDTCDPWPADEPVLILPYLGQPMTFTEAKNLALGLPTSPLDFRSPASQRHYMTTGIYLTEDETGAL
ncbi:hypothetical protein [Kitasatospora aureofaciens]|uniref:hypothetical protein n=1 Tax=Kitasatospora aureofaciens TaxID=1894 RepID=UPI00068CCA0B|nr:hypothetical protein [Kitasatospora aureofaciens]